MQKNQNQKNQNQKKIDKKGAKDTTADEKKPDVNNVDIDFNGLEERMVILPLSNGNYGQLSAAKGKIIYLKFPTTGLPDGIKSFT